MSERDYSQPFLSSPFEIDLAIFEDSSGEFDLTPPSKKAKITPEKKDVGTSMHGTLTPEQVTLCAINKKRAIQLQLSLRAIRDMEEALKELREDAERLKQPISACFDLFLLSYRYWVVLHFGLPPSMQNDPITVLEQKTALKTTSTIMYHNF
jgi:hypothetical protein